MAVVAPAHLMTVAEARAQRSAKFKWEITARVDEHEAQQKFDEQQLGIWRRKVWKRDKDLCRCCGVKVDRVLNLIPTRAEAHHIRPREHRPTRTEVRNGLTLCHSCHKRVTGMVADKLRVIATKWFTLNGQRYINGSAPVTFKKVA